MIGLSPVLALYMLNAIYRTLDKRNAQTNTNINAMKKLLTLTLLVSFMGLWSCAYDDTPIWEKVNDHENRISYLEQLCTEMNSNISAMQTILEALENNDYITGVTPIVEGGETVGYTISFAKSDSITIYHGKDGANGANGKDGTNGEDGADGEDGYTPVVGVRQDIDGVYYWTLDGEWLTDELGNKIKAIGVDGANGANGEDGKDGADGNDGANGVDGITPLLKIDNDYWYISYDNGSTWTELGKAKGEDGKNYCEFFEDITETEDEVIFTLVDGTVISVLKDKPFSLELDTDNLEYSIGMTYHIGFTITGATANTVIEVIPSNNLRAYVSSYRIIDGVATGDVVVEMPKAILEYATVAVIVSDGHSKVIMKAIHFEYEGSEDIEDGILYVTNGEAFNFPKEGGELEVNIQTNISYRVEVDPSIKEWLSIADTRAALREETLTLYATENLGVYRHGFVYIIDVSNNHIVETLYVSQNSDEVYYEEVILFHESFNNYMVSNFDVNKDGVVTRLEALEAVTINVPTSASDLSGMEYCVNLKHLTIKNNSNIKSLNTSTLVLLESLDISGSSIETIDLSHNPLLKSFNCASSKVAALDLAANNQLETVNCSSLGSLKNNTLVLENHHSLTRLICNSSNLTMLNISGCPELYELNCSNNKLSELDVTRSPKIEVLTINNNNIYELDLSKSVELRKFNCLYNQLRSLNLQACMKLHEYNFNNNPLQILNLGSVPRLKSVKVQTYHSTDYDFAISGLEIESFEVSNIGSDYFKNIIFDTPNIKSVYVSSYSGADIDFSSIPSVETIKLDAKNVYNIDITKNSNLKSFEFNGGSNPNIKEIDFSYNSELTSVKLTHCGITGLDLSNNLKVTDVKLIAKNCKYINLGYNPVLKELDPLLDSSIISIPRNEHDDLIVIAPLLESLTLTECGGYVDVTACPNLTYLKISPHAHTTTMQALDLSNQTKLQTLVLEYQPNIPELQLWHLANLESVTITGCGGLSNLDLSGLKKLTSAKITSNDNMAGLNLKDCTALTTLNCYSNKMLAELNIKHCSAIEELTCYNNALLSALDISDCTALGKLSCYSTSIDELDLSYAPLLTTLDCSSTQIERLDVSFCPLLTTLNCNSTLIESLDVSGCLKLISLDCSPNEHLTTLYMAEGQTISYINPNRNNSYIPDATEIVYVQ